MNFSGVPATDIRNERMCTGLWGLCEKADLVLPRQFLRWLMSEGCLHPDGRGHPQLLQRPEGRAQVEGFSARQQHEIRAQMGGLMAGTAAWGLAYRPTQPPHIGNT